MRKKKVILNPQSVKFIKQQKGFLKPITYKKSATQLCYGLFGLKILRNNRFKVKQLETIRKYISKHLKKNQILWIRLFPDIPITQKPKEIRMGKGKGNVDHWVTCLKAGHILFELSPMSYRKAVFILMGAAKKLNVESILVMQTRKIWY
jgi:large subunit ribosomal protein L16